MPLVLRGGPRIEEPGSPARERARKVHPELTRGPLVRVSGARNQAEAELIQNILLEEGVPSVVRRSAGFDVPDFLAAGPREVLVAESGADVARAALADLDAASPPAPLPAPSPSHVARLAALLLAGAALTALIAWGLVQLSR